MSQIKLISLSNFPFTILENYKLNYRQSPFHGDLVDAAADFNDALGGAEQLFLDASTQAQGMFNGVVGQAMDTTTEFATGAVAGARLQQDAGAVVNEAASDINTLADDGANLLTDVTDAATNLVEQGINNVQNFFGGMMGGDAAPATN